MQDLLYQQYLRQKKKTARWIQLTKEQASEKNVHQMRKEVKKLRAFYQLFALLTSDQFRAKKAYKSIRPVYKPAGKLRDRQLNIKAVEKHRISLESIPLFDNYILKRQDKQQAKLTKQLKKWKAGKLDKADDLIKTICEQTDDHNLLIRAARHFLVEIERIKNLYATKDVIDNIHEMRKILKSLYYIYSLANDVFQIDSLNEWLKMFKDTQSKIGDWHDKIVMRQLINKLLAGAGITPEEKEQLIQLNNKLQTESQRLFKNFDEKLEQITAHKFAKDFSVPAL